MTDPAQSRTTARPGGIVVGVDGSPSSEAALRGAVRQAVLTGQTVHAVTAWDFPRAYSAVYVVDARTDWAEQSDRC